MPHHRRRGGRQDNASQVEGLNLVANQLGDEGAAVLANVMCAYGSLTNLYLGENNIGDGGAKAIAAAVAASAPLTILYLGENNIGNEGAKALAEAIRASGSLALKDLYVGNALRKNVDLKAACQAKGVRLH